MSGKILAGPLLGLESDTHYTVSFLADKSAVDPEIVVDDMPFTAERIQDTPTGVFWRASIDIKPAKAGRLCRYAIKSGGSVLFDPRGCNEWKFWVPGERDEPRIAYASCNGFSTGDAKAKLDEPYGMWRRMAEDHEREPFSLLIMGGDQIYADEIWHSRDRAPSIGAFSRLSRREKINMPVDKDLMDELDSFYESLYKRHWDQPEMSQMMASIPSLMMWDDHDIFDGWGSYPADLQNSPVYQAIFAAARRYFELFQLRSRKNVTLLNAGGEHYSFGLRFRDYGIVGLDNRSNRTENMVMNEQNWSDVKRWLKDNSGSVRTLLVMTAVPVVYRRFQTIESAFDITPWEEELTDDVRDQWASRYHEGERMKLIMNLFEFKGDSKSNSLKRVLLSGDVHVGCAGIISDGREPNQKRLIHQLVSSAIVHPAPTWLEWLGLKATTDDDPEVLEGGEIRTKLIEPYGAGKVLRTRNYARLKEGNDGKLWVNWVCENGTSPVLPIEASL